MRRDLASAANDNLRDTFVTVAEEFHSGECRQFGPLSTAATGVPVPIFNHVFVFDAPPTDRLSAAVEWMSRRDVPFWVTVADPVAEAVETDRADLDRDIVKAAEHPGMALAPLQDIPNRYSVAEFAEVTDPEELEPSAGSQRRCSTYHW